MGGYQNYGPFLGPLKTMCRIILRKQKGAIILTATHIPYWHDRTGHPCRPKCPNMKYLQQAISTALDTETLDTQMWTLGIWYMVSVPNPRVHFVLKEKETTSVCHSAPEV